MHDVELPFGCEPGAVLKVFFRDAAMLAQASSEEHATDSVVEIAQGVDEGRVSEKGSSAQQCP